MGACMYAYTYVCIYECMYAYVCTYVCMYAATVDWEIFTLKIIRVKNFHGVKCSQFCSIREIFLTVDGYDVDERHESF